MQLKKGSACRVPYVRYIQKQESAADAQHEILGLSARYSSECAWFLAKDMRKTTILAQGSGVKRRLALAVASPRDQLKLESVDHSVEDLRVLHKVNISRDPDVYQNIIYWNGLTCAQNTFFSQSSPTASI